MENRKKILQQIKNNSSIQVLILGGGVDGTGIYRDLALQGINCVLIDKSDFAAGASSKSSRMIHGGLRYLENREFALVAEAVHERNLLLENAAHFVSPLKTTIPLFSWFQGMIRSSLHFFGLPVIPNGRGVFIVKTGLMFYDFLTGKKRKIPKHFLTGKLESLKSIPGLNPAIVGTATYWDAKISQVERLCVEMIQDAEEACPLCRSLNYVTVQSAKGGDVTLKDLITGESFTTRPKVVINATGAWIDITNQLLGFETHFMGGTKGSHLVINNDDLFNALEDRMIFYEHTDGRICIAFRFMDKVIIGSTDLHIDDPETASCTEEEIDYMLETLHTVFPAISISRKDILFKYCGVRPLASSKDSVTGTISRAHKIEITEAGNGLKGDEIDSEPGNGLDFPVFSMVGGKLTTFRAFAEQTCDHVLERLRLQRKKSTEHIRIRGSRNFPADETERTLWIERVASKHNLKFERVATLLERYGTLAEEILESYGGKPETPLRCLPGYSKNEIEYIVSKELVEHLSDLVCRRSVIALLGLASPGVLKELAAITAPILGWDETQQAEEVKIAIKDVGTDPRAYL